MKRIYLDYNATTPVAPSVVDAMRPFLAEQFGNPSSSHVFGKAAAQAVIESREHVSNMIGAYPEEIVFTSGGTESINLAIKGLCFRRMMNDQRGHVIISEIEHPATAAPAAFIETLGFDVSRCGCDAHGVVAPDEVESLFRDDTFLVSLMHANNETGCIQPVAEVARRCRARGILTHTDAAQSVGKIPVSVEDLAVDLMSIAGHKLYAPKGIGALFVRTGIDLEPLIHGADHEFGLRAGTENVPLIVALGKASVLAASINATEKLRLAKLRDRLLQRLRDGIGKTITVNGEAAERLPNTLSVNFPDVAGHALLEGAREVCASTGAACHSGTGALSATLRAMGSSPETARGTVRMSLGWPTSMEEIDTAADLLCESWNANAC